MSEQALPVTRTPSGLRRMLLVLPVLLVVAVLVNWGSLTDIARGRRTVHSVVYGVGQQFGHMGTFTFPAPSGPADAKVKVLVVAQEGNGCHLSLVQLWQAIGALAAERVRVVFVSRSEAMRKLGGKPLDLGCETGVVINGKTKFVLTKNSRKRTVYFTKPHPAMMPATPPPDAAKAGTKAPPKAAPPMEMGWSLDDLVQVVNSEINKAYGQGGSLTVGAVKAAQDALAQQAGQQGAPAGPLAVPPPGAQPPKG